MSSPLDRLRARFPKGSFVRNVGVLAGGAALAQGLAILASPLLSRLYSPADFGVLAVYASLLGIVAVVASLRYELAVPLPADDALAANVLGLSLGLVLLTSALTGVAVWAFGERIVGLANAPGLGPYLWLLPLGVLALGLYQALNYWAVRRRAFGRIARTKLNQGASSVVTQLTLGLLQFGPAGLLLGHIAGQAAGTGTLATLALKGDGPAMRSVSPKGMLAAARRYDRFPKYATAGALLNSSSLNLPSVMLTAIYGTAVAGWYYFAQRLLRTPLTMVSNSVSQVYYGEAPRLAESDPRRLLELFRKTAWRLLGTAAVPLLLVALVGPWAFSALFGEQWAEAGAYSRLLAPYLLLQFAFGPISQTFSILESQRLLLLLNGSKLLLAVGPLLLAGHYGLPAQTAVLAHSLGLAANYVMAYLLCTRLIRDRIRTHEAGAAGA